jgi:hypothetical protein
MKQATHTTPTLTREKLLASLKPEERKLIEWIEAVQQHKLNLQEIHLALEQAKHIGEVDE